MTLLHYNHGAIILTIA